MGWLKSCIDFALQVTQWNPFDPFVGFDNGQHPLQLPSQNPLTGSTSQTAAAPAPFQCSYPELERKGWEFCNGPESRACWMRDPKAPNSNLTQFDINTNYEDDVPPGIVRPIWLEVTTNETVSPDGMQKILGNYFNGTYPGPTIEACWGDQLVINVKNKVETNGTTIHWHGIRMLNTNEMDGVNGITQCPIAYDHSFTYNFTLMQYGHTWYHSHYSLQYPDGVAAPLVIHGPTSANWDIDLGPIHISDWIHDTAYRVYEVEKGGAPPKTDSIVVNGKGHWGGDPTVGSYYETTFTPGKKHLLRLINGAASTSFKFSIDNHTLQVVATDLVPVEPFFVDSLFIGIGQRYTIIVQAKDEADGDYWMRTLQTSRCSGFNIDPADNRTAIVRYNQFPLVHGLVTHDYIEHAELISIPHCRASTALPQSPMNPQNNTCEDVHPDLLNPIIPWRVDKHPQNNVTKDTFFAKTTNITDGSLGEAGNYIHWELAAQLDTVGHPLWIDFDRPTILDPFGAIADPNYMVIEESYDHGFVYLIIDASNVPVTHPIHLHGSDFVILAQTNSSQRWNESTSPDLFRFDNPPRRDVAMLHAGGFLALAFRPDNPGAWLLHCHIAWHASSGLALQILVRPDEIDEKLGDLTETRRVCHAWRHFDNTQHIEENQEDSGI